MKIQDIRKKDAVELKKLIDEFSEELREFHFGMSGGQKKNIRHARAVRKDIARVKTVLNETK
ncbi:MAG: 50S ribosomal protein L29 [Candidatus Paceibacteria bacterium]